MWNYIKQSQTSIAIFLASLVIFTYGLYPQEIISFDSRFYLFALEMWRHGVTWFPTTYLQSYPDYTVLSTLLVYWTSIMLGGLNKLSAVLPNAIAAALTVVLTFHIGALYSRRMGYHAALLLLFTVAFFKSARAMALDIYPTVITAACFYLLHSAKVLALPRRVLWIYPLLVLSYLFRGPIGIVIPTGVVCIYYLLDRDYARFFKVGCMALCLLLLCTAGLLYLAYHTGGALFLEDVFRMQVAGRIDNTYLPFYFYFTNSFLSYAITYPLAVLVIAGIFIYRKELADYSLLLKWVGWVLVIIVGMSIPGDKKVRYILPFAPALALLSAYAYSVDLPQRYFYWLQRGMMGLFFFAPTFFLLGAYYVAHIIEHTDLAMSMPLILLTIFFVCAQLASIAVYVTSEISQRPTILLVSACSCFIVSAMTLIEPLELAIDSAHNFVVQIESMREQEKVPLVFYREQPDSMPIKYVINMPQEEMPVFLHTTDELLAWHAPAFFVTSQTYFDELSKKQQQLFTLIAMGKIGHVEVVVFRRNK